MVMYIISIEISRGYIYIYIHVCCIRAKADVSRSREDRWIEKMASHFTFVQYSKIELTL